MGKIDLLDSQLSEREQSHHLTEAQWSKAVSGRCGLEEGGGVESDLNRLPIKNRRREVENSHYQRIPPNEQRQVI